MSARSILFIAVVLAAATAPGSALATVGADPSVNYVVAPGSTADGDAVGRVITPSGNSCSGTLLGSGRHVLTAGHCAGLSGATGASGSVNWNTPSGIVSQNGVYRVHSAIQSFIDDYGPGGTYLGVQQGFDLAILELDSDAPSSVTRSDILRDDTGVELGLQALRIGYGQFGFGAGGATNAPDGQKRYAWNEFESSATSAVPSLLPWNAYPDQILISDFDNGLAANSSFGGNGLGSLEGASARGDSGGPVFTYHSQSLISGVTSGGINGLSTDTNPFNLASFGDINFDVRVASLLNRKFIDIAVDYNLSYGDTDASGQIDVNDINTLFAAIAFSASTTDIIDLNDDGLVSHADVDVLVNDLIQTDFGDADFDGDVDAADEAIVTANLGTVGGGWLSGDFDGDNIVTSTDLSVLQANLGFDRIDQYAPTGSTTPSLPINAWVSTHVPEPTSILLLALATLPVMIRRTT